MSLLDLPILTAPSSETPCGSCNSGCCRNNAVPISGADLFRLVSEGGLDPWQFLCRWEDTSGLIGRGIAPQFYFEDAPGVPFVIGLLSAESEQSSGGRKCAFLAESPEGSSCGTSGCSVYEQRPAACRVFPFRWTDAGGIGLQSVTSPSGAPVTLCPTRWNITPEQAAQAADDLTELQSQMELFKSVAAVWNRNPGLWELFPEFILSVYERLAPAVVA